MPIAQSATIVRDALTIIPSEEFDMSIFDRYELLVPERSRKELALLRWALVIVFSWFGAMKFTAY